MFRKKEAVKSDDKTGNLKIFSASARKNIADFQKNILKTRYRNSGLYHIPRYMVMSSPEIGRYFNPLNSLNECEEKAPLMFDGHKLWAWRTHQKAVFIHMNTEVISEHLRKKYLEDALPAIAQALRGKRKLAPLNGLVIFISSDENFGKYASICRDIAHHTGRPLPIYIAIVDHSEKGVVKLKRALPHVNAQYVLGHLADIPTHETGVTPDKSFALYENTLEKIHDFLLSVAPGMSSEDFRTAYDGYIRLVQNKEKVRSSLVELIKGNTPSGKFFCRGMFLVGKEAREREELSFLDDFLSQILPSEQSVAHQIRL